MEELFMKFSNFRIKGTDEEKLFEDFYNNNQYRCIVEEWVNSIISKLTLKNDEEASRLKTLGNHFYSKRNFINALKLYTKALCNAVPNEATYYSIIANRSAVFYMMKYYENSLNDISVYESYINFDNNIKLKVLIRKAKCFHKMKLDDKAHEAISEASNFLEKCNDIDKKKKKNELLAISEEEQCNNIIKSIAEDCLPLLKDDENSNFLCASSVLQLCYDNIRGRHVRTKKQIEIGDVLFVEKPFIFAPVFISEDMNLSLDKCYHCLSYIMNSIPCKYCIRCVYCNDDCLEKNWNDFHHWECLGMQANLWYKIGIAFPALRAVIKGISTGLCNLKSTFEDDTLSFGNKNNNYGYFNKLVSNMSMMANLTPLVISSLVIVVYLKEKTDFFNWLHNETQFSEKSVNELIILIGGRLVKHIAQLQSNSSVVVHKKCNFGNFELEENESVACAIYPSISMMNHACKSNITIRFIKDVEVVEAAEFIDKGGEVLNCYGMDYRFTDRKSRQEQCQELYYFKCNCRVCSHPELEFL